MWSRKVIKNMAKDAVKRNYWKMVLIGLLLAFLTGELVSITDEIDSNDLREFRHNDYSYEYDFDFDDEYDDDFFDDEYSQDFDDKDLGDYEYEYRHSFDRGFKNYLENHIPFGHSRQMRALLAASIGFIITVVIIASAIGILLTAFIFNPLVVGGNKFFYNNIKRNEDLGVVSFAFDHGYRNVAYTMFMRDLFTFLWTLLFIIPGLIKMYEYRMIPYLLAENPDMSCEDAFKISRRMMDGNKWDAFVFDLSFIGWGILSAITFNIVGIFYYFPYYFQASAMLYDAIKIDDQHKWENVNGFSGNGGFDQTTDADRERGFNQTNWSKTNDTQQNTEKWEQAPVNSWDRNTDSEV